jgi:hypothetical protein
MKKSLLFLSLMIFVTTGILAQYSKVDNLGRMPVTSHTKALTGTIATTSLNYVAGATFDIEVVYNHVSADEEYVDGISLDFPAGVTVNSGTDFELTCNGETGDGALITWGDMAGGSGFGDLASSTVFTVNVTVGVGFTGDITVAYAVVGDGYGAAPHTLAGNFVITEAAGNDAGITSVSPQFVMEGESAYPSVTVENFGATTFDDFDVEVVINDGTTDVYTSTLNVTGAGLAFGTDDEFAMPDLWTPANGNYTITATVTLTGDLNATNDESSVLCFVGSYSAAHASNSTDLTYGTINLVDGLFTTSGTVGVDPFPMAEEFDGNVIWRVYDDLSYGIIDPMGSYSAVGTFTGVAGTPTGLAYNFDSDVMYTVILDASNLPQLCTVDLLTGVCTLIGAGTEGMIIGIDFAIDGFIYGPDLGDNLYQIDPTTGAVTLIGALGIDINYGQDVSYDYFTQRLYTITCGAVYEFGYYDLTTGAFTSIADMAGDQYATFVVTNIPVGPIATSHLPESNNTTVALDATVSVTFNVDITEVDFTGITVTPDPGNVVASIVDNVLTLAHDDFDFNTEYTVLVPAGAVSDGTDDLAYDVEWSFTTALDPTACNDPSDVIISAITIDGANVAWTENGVATQWNVLYGPAGFDPMTEGDQVTVDVTNTTLTELDSDTDYEVYVQAICGAETSGWAGPATFTTLYDCSTVTTITQGFEQGVPPICWETYQSGAGTKVWTVSTTVYNNGAASAVANYENSGSENVQWLVSNEVIVPDNNKLVFWTRDQYTPAYSSTLTVKISTDNGLNYTDLLTLTESQVVNTAFTMFEIPLNTYAGQSVKIAFVMTDDDGDNWFVDDVNFEVITNIESEINNLFTVYPNPSNGVVNIAVTENSVVSVMDVAGRTVAMYNVNANEEVSFTQSAGMYIVKVESNGKVSTHKLVIE